MVRSVQKHSILTDDTYEIILERCRREIEEGETKHLLVLLGVPVAYPRLVWLENILTSRAMAPVKTLSKSAIFKGGLLNKFDGGVEILDDLEDHWTANGHKEERNLFIHDLQELAAEKSVRVTILGGDVHLGAVGQFYSNPKLRISKDRDHRYIPNVISSAIVNSPPPELLADTLNKRNKLHYLDPYTVEDMIPLFTHDVDGKKRNNKKLLPRRNWCSIREYHPGSTPPPTPPEPSTPSDRLSETEDYPRPSPGGSGGRFSFSRGNTRPGSLLRRLSQRDGPAPTSYRDEAYMARPNVSNGGGSHFPWAANSEPQSAPENQTSFPPSLANHQQAPPQSAPPGRTMFEQPGYADESAKTSAVRPGIYRRPTALSEKDHQSRRRPTQGVGGQVDVKAEEELHDHINLEGGLDVKLNCEVSQGDPAGITTPYRLLIPALQYDGTSDRQKLGSSTGLQKTQSLLKKIRIASSSHRATEARPGSDDRGQYMSESGSETESVSDTDEEEDDDRIHDGGRGLPGADGLRRWFSNRRRPRRQSQPTTARDGFIQSSAPYDIVDQPQIEDVNAQQPFRKDNFNNMPKASPLAGPNPARYNSNMEGLAGHNSQGYDSRTKHVNISAKSPVLDGTRAITTRRAFDQATSGTSRSQTLPKAARMLGVEQGTVHAPSGAAPNVTSSSMSPQTASTSTYSTASPSSSSSSSSSSSDRSREGNARDARRSRSGHGTGRRANHMRTDYLTSSRTGQESYEGKHGGFMEADDYFGAAASSRSGGSRQQFNPANQALAHPGYAQNGSRWQRAQHHPEYQHGNSGAKRAVSRNVTSNMTSSSSSSSSSSSLSSSLPSASRTPTPPPPPQLRARARNNDSGPSSIPWVPYQSSHPASNNSKYAGDDPNRARQPSNTGLPSQDAATNVIGTPRASRAAMTANWATTNPNMQMGMVESRAWSDNTNDPQRPGRSSSINSNNMRQFGYSPSQNYRHEQDSFDRHAFEFDNKNDKNGKGNDKNRLRRGYSLGGGSGRGVVSRKLPWASRRFSSGAGSPAESGGNYRGGNVASGGGSNDVVKDQWADTGYLSNQDNGVAKPNRLMKMWF